MSGPFRYTFVCDRFLGGEWWGLGAYVDSRRAVVAALVVVQHGEAEAVEGFGNAAVLVAGFLP